MNRTTIDRILGGSPLAVLLKLCVLSLLTGAAMAWLNIEPLGLWHWAERLAFRLWDSGLDAVRQFAGYLAAGAAIVVPLWILTRILSAGSGGPRRAMPGRWSLPGAPPTEGAPPVWRQGANQGARE